MVATIWRILQAKSCFLVLQALDLLTTLGTFHLGAYEANPLVAHLITLLGPVGGVLCSKAIASLIVLRVQKLVWVANLLYSGVVFWNVFILAVFGLAHALAK